MKYLLIFLTFLIIDCSDNDNMENQQTEKKSLDKLAKEIKFLANESICSDEFTCSFIGFGSKPCGGNWEYLVYSSSIDVPNLLIKVKEYNELEKKYNTKYGIISDCMIVLPPSKVVCDGGKCKAYFDE